MSKFEEYVPQAHFSVAAATVLLVIVGIWGVIETKGALEATQRAWITPIGAALVQQLEADQGVRFAIFLVNPGREPATDITLNFKNTVIDSYDTRFTAVTDVDVPENTSCAGLDPIPGRAVMAPSGGNNIAIAWNFDSRHAQPQFLIDDRILNGSKFYVTMGCAAYKTYSKSHKSSFCYILERRAGVQQSGPPNIIFNPAPPQNMSSGNIGGLQLPGYKPLESHSYSFATCAKGFFAD